jgi:DHA1 family tetracycline resistance protein-like MFS transporter
MLESGPGEFMTASPTSKYAISFIFITVLLDMVGFGLIIPVQPAIIKEIGHLDIAHASLVGGWMFFAFSATQFLFGPALGSLSDAYGRRPLLLLSVFGLGCDYLITALAPSLGWLFVGRLLAGLCGASYVIANAYIADVTPPEGRAKAFGMMGAAFGLGFVIGRGTYGPRVPFFVAAGVSALNLVFGYFVVPETLGADKRRAFDVARANPLGTFKVFQQYKGVLPLCGVLFVYFFAGSVYPAIWPFWGIAKFGWSPAMLGLTLATFGIIMAFVQAVLTGPAVKFFGERKVALIGLGSAVIGSIGFALAPSFAVVVIFLVLHGPEGFVHPMLSAIISKQVPDDAQGELQGGISSIMSISMLFGTVFFSQEFGYFMSGAAGFISPNIAMMTACGLFAMAALVLLITWRSHRVKA